MKKQQLPFVGGGWEVGRKEWADDDGEDDDLVTELVAYFVLEIGPIYQIISLIWNWVM